MRAGSFASWVISQEARALLTRLERIKSFAMAETCVPAAALTVEAQSAIERYLQQGRRELREQLHHFLAWVEGPDGQWAAPAQLQRRFTFLRLRFNVVLSHFDIFSEAMSQRSEVDNGVWLAGLDVVARDALELPGYCEAPPVICYLARGPGAAIRRARTRLPGGGENPVALIRVPRERMIGSAIASSLIHEVGHQGAALLDLVPSLRLALAALRPADAGEQRALVLWERWLSEMVADYWSVARVGIAASFGLLGVVSLPRPFVFRPNADDPHPMPWIRVKLSCALGQALYPHPQWAQLSRLWEELYPLEGLDAGRRQLIAALEASLPRVVALLVEHRPAGLRGRTLAEVMDTPSRQPARLASLLHAYRARQRSIRAAAPSLAFAVVGQGRASGALAPEEEGEALADLLRYWAVRGTVDTSEVCAVARRSSSRPSPPALPPAALQLGVAARSFIHTRN